MYFSTTDKCQKLKLKSIITNFLHLYYNLIGINNIANRILLNDNTAWSYCHNISPPKADVWSYWIFTQPHYQDSCVTVLWKSEMTRGSSASRTLSLNVLFCVWPCFREVCYSLWIKVHTAFNINIPPLMWCEAYLCISQFAEIQQSKQACFLLVVNPWVTAIRRVLFSRAHPSTAKWENLFQPPVSLGCLLRGDTCDSLQGKNEGWMILRYQTPFSQSAPTFIHHLTNL